jgi:hypothetical protein
MSANAKKQTAMTTEFMQVTSASSAQAQKFLQKFAWNSERAIDAFFQSGEAPDGPPASAGRAASAKKMEEEFYRLAGEASAESLLDDGLLKLNEELGVDLEN